MQTAAPAIAVYTVEVDVAVARPPSPRNIRTVGYLVGVNADQPFFDADIEAQLIACRWAATIPGVVMPVASRIVSMVC